MTTRWERNEKRLAHLRQRFPTATKTNQADKDHSSVTSADKTHISDRTFYLGEIFWVKRKGWHACGGFETNTSRLHHPGLVVLKQANPVNSVRMVPGTTKLRQWGRKEPHIFSNAEDIKWKSSPEKVPDMQFFILDYWRPVCRRYIGAMLARLAHVDQCRLQDEMKELYSNYASSS